MGIAKPRMSDEELARRKRAQARFSITGSTLGLTALGLKGGSAAAKLVPKAERLTAAIPALKKIPADAPKRISDAATTTAIGAAGVGGVGGYNFAAYTKEDARRNHNKQKVRKAMAGDSEGTEVSFKLKKRPERSRTIQRVGQSAAGAGIGAALGIGYGKKGLIGGALAGSGAGAVAHVPKYKVELTRQERQAMSQYRKPSDQVYAAHRVREAQSKRDAKKAVSKRIEMGIYKGYDPEERRQRMSGAAAGVGAAGAGGLGYLAAKEGMAAKKTVDAGTVSNIKSYRKLIDTTRTKQPGMTLKRAGEVRRAALKEISRGSAATKLKAIKQGKKAAILGAGALAAGATSAGLTAQANKRGRTYQTWY